MSRFSPRQPIEITDEQLFARRAELRKAGVPLHKVLPLARVQLMRERLRLPSTDRNV